MTNKKLKVGFTCSSFDLLHPGHVVMLKDCKNVCDYLIVGLQIDPSIDQKTKVTPIQSLKERAFMVRSVKYVDEVIKYKTEADLYEILKDLNPDIRILGANWKAGENRPTKQEFKVRNMKMKLVIWLVLQVSQVQCTRKDVGI